ncbi:helix-turn-helix domain-containing protein [Raineyella fluvialis]|uniref:Helix-turn-helix domain-containing protein n=1 Tax=Raineyella fluvialis TaxID=2662261 RepID=A0A5Q2FI13_9ACTN|nr:helix-turn-helix transcriptional regulator [Raineyella fluvialis]QGF24813.1 helix-turn-helix domain-containing protein [Raineyella fluvialis]
MAPVTDITRPALMREHLGASLRSERVEQGKTLREVSRRAGVSLGYLSEVERGQKEASSELLAAICGALDVPMSHVIGDVAERMAVTERTVRPLPLRPHATAAAA